MFNLLQGLETRSGNYSYPLSRVYSTYQRGTLTCDIFEEFAKNPTIVMEEGAPIHGGRAYFVKVSNFQVNSTNVNFDVVIDDAVRPFSAIVFEQSHGRHELDRSYNWHHTCWQFGTGNVYETLYRGRDLNDVNEPSVFKLKNPPEVDATKVSCMMPFSAQFDDIYTAIGEACSSLQLVCRRADDIYSNKPIIDDVIRLIDEARVVVCDLSGRNANVLYETGIAHAIGREVVIITQNIDDVPFDLRHLRCVEYSGSNQKGRKELKKKLAKTMKEVLGI